MEIAHSQAGKSHPLAFGHVLAREYWDTLIRNEEDSNRAVAYIEANPERTGLVNWPWVGNGSREG